jgi:hypothetical protein
MRLENKDKNILIERFPEIELSYEKISHNKVSFYDFCLCIPQGKKCFLWFTYLYDKNVCLTVEMNKFNHIENINIEICQYSKDLSLGTIFYGTIIFYNNNKVFCCEDIIFYKNENIYNHSYSKKLSLINTIFKNEINQSVYTNREMIVSIPIITNKKESLLEQIRYLPYDVYNIQFRSFKNNRVFNTPYNSSKNKAPRLNFKVKSRIESDIYELYCYENNNFTFYDIAFVPDYKTSVYMNNIFRNIRENRNLDYLEESDDEENFQNIDIDKYVDLNIEKNITCEYNFRHRKWVPIRLCKDRKIVNKRDIRKALIQKS